MFWNESLYDVLVWLNTASTEDQRLLLHRYHPFSPTHRFTHVVGKWQKWQMQVYAEKHTINCILLNFILYKVLDHLVLCSPNFTADLFTKEGTIWHQILERPKVKEDDVQTTLDLPVMSHHPSVSNFLSCGYYGFVCYCRLFAVVLSIYAFLTSITAASLCEGCGLSNIGTVSQS